jgi:hypothetical protein
MRSRPKERPAPAPTAFQLAASKDLEVEFYKRLKAEKE